jgi:hypothetical protein
LTARVLEAVARAKPHKLLVFADGPRPDRPDDVVACAATRAVIDGVNWNCEVVKNYSEVNLGCGRGPATGISWVFQQVEEAIILEDDCVPHPSFFQFCEELLERYRDDARVMHVAGCTYRREPWPISESYYFSRFNGAWGWATWRRAWQHFDLSVPRWSSLRNTSFLSDILEDKAAVRYWAEEFQQAYDHPGDVSYWDHQWTFACWANSGLTVAPKHNLVSNVGCGPGATHTLDENDPAGNLPLDGTKFPLVHPSAVIPNRDLDRQKLHELILPRLPKPPTSMQRLRQAVARVTPSFVKQGYRRLASQAMG